MCVHALYCVCDYRKWKLNSKWKIASLSMKRTRSTHWMKEKKARDNSNDGDDCTTQRGFWSKSVRLAWPYVRWNLINGKIKRAFFGALCTAPCISLAKVVKCLFFFGFLAYSNASSANREANKHWNCFQFVHMCVRVWVRVFVLIITSKQKVGAKNRHRANATYVFVAIAEWKITTTTTTKIRQTSKQ